MDDLEQVRAHHFRKDRKILFTLVSCRHKSSTYVGLAACSAKDQPCKRRGRNIALGRIQSYIKHNTGRFVLSFDDPAKAKEVVVEARKLEQAPGPLIQFIRALFNFTPVSWECLSFTPMDWERNTNKAHSPSE